MTLKSKKLVKFKNVSHGFFGKKGGVSNGIYSALNCGPGSNDKISNVKKNLKIVSKKFKVSPKNLILLKQTHSNNCLLYTSPSPRDATLSRMPSSA